MAQIKSMQRITTKWDRQSAVSGPEYQAGIENPKTDWATAAAAAEELYKAGIQAAIQRGAFGKGIKASGTDNWKKKALAKGVSRWSEGIAVSQDSYAKGFQPYHDVISRIALPPRGPKGSPANILRVSTVTNALHAEKIKRQTA